MAKRRPKRNQRLSANQLKKKQVKTNGLKANRKYKDTLFRMLFSDKENLLSLYNAVNGTAYTDPEQLQMEQCKVLREYAQYVDRVRDYVGKMGLDAGVSRAVNECIQEGILAEFLRQNRAEAKKVSIFEYNVDEKTAKKMLEEQE